MAEKKDHRPKQVRKQSTKKKLKDRVLIKRILIIGIIIFAVILILFLFSKIKFMISDELNLKLSPLQQSLFTTNNETAIANISLVNENFLQCSSICELNLTDLSEGKTLISENITLKHNQRISRAFNLSGPKKGSGQKLFSYTVMCSNIKSIVCLTDGMPRYRYASIAVNYDLTSDEQWIKISFKPRLEQLLETLNESSVLLQQNRALLASGPGKAKETIELERRVNESEKLFDNLETAAINLTRLWSEEDYLALNATFSDDLLTRGDSINNGLMDEQSAIVSLLELSNSNIETLKSLKDEQDRLAEAVTTYQQETNPSNNNRLKTLNKVSASISIIFAKIISKSAYSVAALNNDTQNAMHSLKAVLDDYYATEAEKTFLISLGSNLLANKNASTNISLDSGCEGIKQVIGGIYNENNNATGYRILYYNWSIEDQAFDDELTRFSAAQEGKALSATIADLQNSIAKYKDLALQLANDSYSSFNNDQFNQMLSSHDFNSSFNLTADELQKLFIINNLRFIGFSDENCRQENFSSSVDANESNKLLSMDFSAISNFTASTEIPDITLNDTPEIQDNPAMCCVSSDCKACCGDSCSNDENLDPVIFLHGHSFNQANAPDYSLDAFSKMQSRLEEDGYLSLGQLDLQESTVGSVAGVWGRASVPVSFKASYYYITQYNLGVYTITIRNDEGIENYAIRLKDIIDLVKYQTGRDKVNIVAHSMGGLVARDYLALFGNSSVNKVILINSPNKGISGKVKDLCSVTGSKLECGDMSAGSIFLNRLNSQSMAANQGIYNIRTIGCSMEGGMVGDGVVTNESAYLEGAKNYLLKGNCTGAMGTGLHLDVLDPDLYPGAYELVLKLLKE